MFGQDDNHKPNDDNQQDSQPANDVIEPSATTDDSNWQHPGPPPEETDDSPSTEDSPAPAPTPTLPVDTPPAEPADSPAPDAGASASDDLIELKRDALTQLTPLVDQLDQAPDEKFRTLMMMIQASDDQSLVKQAYETAQKIDNEKERAQALLDIVNEINYFTQNSPTSTPQ